MRKSKVLTRLRAGQPVKLAMLGHFLPPFVAYAAHAGYDGIWLDLEHRPLDRRDVTALLAFFHLYDIDCVLRPPTREKGELYRYLEDGAAGLVIPHVSDVSAARELVQKVKFPPVGDRGVEGGAFDADFGLGVSRQVLVEHALRETFLWLQIETPQGLAQVEQIAAVPGIDGLYVGPGDLGLRLDLLPDGQRISLEDALKRVAAACQSNGLPWGSMPRTIEEARQHVALGARILMWGVDTWLLRESLAHTGQQLDEILNA